MYRIIACETEALGMVMCCEWHGSMSGMVASCLNGMCTAVNEHLDLAHLQVLACVQDLGLYVRSHARCCLYTCLNCQVCFQVCLHLSHLAFS